MSRSERGVLRLALVVTLALAPAPPAGGNGETQREVQGRVVSIDGRTGTLVVASEFRGRMTRVTLRAGPGVPVYGCSGEPTTLDRVKQGTAVSVFYEVLGAEGVANLVVMEPAP
jgi:hypothetical protein